MVEPSEAAGKLLALLNSDKASEVIEVAEWYDSVMQEAPELRLPYAAALARSDRVADAMAQLELLLENRPHHAVARAFLQELTPKAQPKVGKEDQADEKQESDSGVEPSLLVNEAIALLQEDKFPSALERIERARETGGSVRDLNYVSAIYFFKVGLDEDGVNHLHKELELFPDNQDARSLLQMVEEGE